ncbi:MAG: EthD family reductase [Cyclobacteriaceae bacterium]
MKTNIAVAILAAAGLLTSCQQTAPTETATTEAPQSEQADAPESKAGLIKVTILYPNRDGSTFDMDYYTNKHMPMVADLLGDAMKFLEIDEGIGGRSPDESMPYLAIGYLYFDKLSDYQDAFGPVAEQILNDIPNYTNIQPVVQISEVLQ